MLGTDYVNILVEFYIIL